MGEKVKLTREQAEAIKSIRGDINGGFTQGNIRTQLKKQWRNKPYATLNELPFEQFIVAVLGDYEIEETFKVGDWIYSKQVEKFIKIEDEGQLEGYNKFPSYYRSATPEEIAEEKQRRWWAKHGREVWELKQGDILKDKRNRFLYEYQRIGDAFLGKTIRLVRFNEGRYDFWKKDVTEHFKVVCFAEDRKDIDGGDSE